MLEKLLDKCFEQFLEEFLNEISVEISDKRTHFFTISGGVFEETLGRYLGKNFEKNFT